MLNLDKSKLTNIHPAPNGGFTAGCPACIEKGQDHTKNHLSVLADGRYSCASNQNDKEHSRRIFQLVGKNIGELENDEYEEKQTIEKLYDSSCLDKLIKDYSYWENKGIPSNIIEPYRGGIAVDGILNKRWVIPIFNDKEMIVGFTGRRLDENMDLKWKHWGKKSKWIWGDLENIKKDKKVILIESIGDFFALKKYGINYGLVVFGIKISQTILGFLISTNVEQITISLNNDIEHDVGQRGAEKMEFALSKFFDENKIKIKLPNKKDFGEMNDEDFVKWKVEAGYEG